MPSVRPIGPSHRIRVVAPSSPFSQEKLTRGIERLEVRGFSFEDTASLVVGEHAYLNGTDEQRRASLEDALASDVDVVWCARGGYGLTRIVSELSFPAGQLPIVVGFSDATALSARLLHRGFRTVHGPLATTVADEPDESLQHLIDILTGRATDRTIGGLRVVANPRDVEGWMFAANLCVLTHLIGTPSMPTLDGAILVLEEVGERPYRIDRQLTHLLESGAFRGVAAFVIGQMIDCDEPARAGRETPTADEVIRERLGGLGVPLLTGAPIGHGTPNYAVVNGGQVRLEISSDDDDIEGDAQLRLLEEVSA